MAKMTDVDIDFPNRTDALSLLDHVPASILNDNKLEKHNTGVYFHATPIDPITNLASIDYKTAEDKGWFKVDLLNVGVYEKIKNEQHLIDLMNRELNWDMFTYPDFSEKLIHVNKHTQLLSDLKPTNIKELAIVLALIRPGQKHLVQKCKEHGFKSIEDEIWIDNGEKYHFKKSHATSYSILVYVHANLLIEELT